MLDDGIFCEDPMSEVGKDGVIFSSKSGKRRWWQALVPNFFEKSW
jgi:hypothetical protein